MPSRRTTTAFASTGLALLLAGCNGQAGTTTVQARASAAPPAGNSTATASPEGTAASSSPGPASSPSSSAPAVPVAPPAPAYDVKAVQRTLTALKYYLAPIDGEPGASFRSAVMAFQKVQGLAADGVVGKATLGALAAPEAPALRATTPANRVEVDLTRQVLYVVEGGALTRIVPVSSGNGATYSQKRGGTAKALTPVGWYTIQRRIVGPEKADLGTLYDPQYFYRGWAIHGSDSVPAGPASHGCVRVTRPDALWLFSHLTVGTSVYLYGGTYTFTAGSSAPGTDNPTGDTPGTASPSPIAKPTPTATPTTKPVTKPRPSPSSPAPAASPTGRPTAAASPAPSASS